MAAAPMTLPIELSGRERAVHEALGKSQTVLPIIYLGAVSVLRQIENPDRLALCAHGMRELFEKLPLLVGNPARPPGQGLKGLVNNLQDAWKRARIRSKCTVDGKWDGTIGEHLKPILGRIDTFFINHSQLSPGRKTEFGVVIGQLDPTRRPLPAPVRRLREDEWEVYHRYFNAVAHHQPGAPVADFEAMLEHAEIFLLEQLRPKTFEHHRELASRIARAEGR